MDFFSNGFQQLFNDLAQDLDFNHNYLNDVNNNNCKEDDTYYSCDYYSYLKDSSCDVGSLLCVTDKTSHAEDIDTKDIDLCLDYFLPLDREDDLLPSQFEWEVDIFDDLAEGPELAHMLPERTALCTNACDSFLKDASENLNLFRRQTIHASDASEKTYPCTFGECGKVYAKPAHLKAHMRRHMGEKPYICTWPDCTWKFSRSDELARHRRSHSGVKPYKCNYCIKCFARSDHLAKHKKVHERRLLAIAGHDYLERTLPASVFHVRPGRKPKNQTFR